MHKRLFAAVLASVASVLLAACSALVGTSSVPVSSPGKSPSAPPSGSSTAYPSASPGASPTLFPSSAQPGAGSVANAAQAAALVLAADPRFAQVAAPAPELIGASAWYEATQTADGYSVTVTLGSGDCQAGCIDQHSWTYSVSHGGAVALVGDEGDPVEYQPPAGTGGPATLRITVQAGPTCPMLRDPPSSACAPRKISGAQVVVHAADGVVVARSITDANGAATVQLPGAAYWIEAMPVAGLLLAPPPQAFSVVGGSSASIQFDFDTGIR